MKDNQPKPRKPQKAYIAAYVAPSIKTAIRKLASQHERPVTWVLEKLLFAALKSPPPFLTQGVRHLSAQSTQ